jgi:hypothetical protein
MHIEGIVWNASTRPIRPERSAIHKADLRHSIGIEVFLSISIEVLLIGSA